MLPFETITLTIANLPVRISRIEDPEALFDELLKQGSDNAEVIDEQIPYWGELWPSAIGLSEFLVKNKNLVEGKNVLEIGCGLGLPGIVAGKLGAKVTLTDYLKPAIDFASHNWKLNFDSEPDIRLLDWRNPKDISPADVLLASDVAYESRSFEPLLKALNTLVKKDGVILISEPNRKFAEVFFERIAQEGFEGKEEVVEVMKDGIKYRISIYQLKIGY